MQLGASLKVDDFEFPLLPKDSLDFDMDRAIGKLDFPGGPPVYQDMGMNEKTLDFSGSFVGDNALDFSQTLESKWWGGQELQLSYGDIQKRVRIQKYSPKIRREDRVDYTIHLIVCFPESELPDLANVYGNQPTTNTSSGSSVSTPMLESTMDKTYTVKDGDTLWDIAASADVYGDGTKWEIIAAANGITDEYSLQVGTILKIPSAQNAGSSQSAYFAQAAAALGSTGESELQNIAGGAT